MPVTAKLSRRVYEQLGDDVANAIVEWFNAVDSTYKADLRELNEVNFARFDAKMGERFARFDERISRFEASVGERISRFEVSVAERFGQIDAKMDRLAAQLNARIENCVDRATFERRLGDVER